MKSENVKIVKVGRSAYLPLKKKKFEENGLSFDKKYDVELTFKEVEKKEEMPQPPTYVHSDE